MNDALEEVKLLLEDHEKRIAELEKLFKQNPDVINEMISPKEFLSKKYLKNDIQKTLAMCYYIEKFKGMLCFNADDVSEVFREAKEPAPKNINLTILYNIQKGFVMESKEKKDNKKAWSLTAKGENFIESNQK